MFGEYNNLRLVGLSANVPANKINNMDLSSVVGEKIIKKQIKATGIVERRCAINGQNTADLCYFAANRLLDAVKWDRNDIKYVVFVSSYPIFAAPATAFYLQRKLGIGTDCLAFDINLACSGFIVGIETIGAFLQNAEEGTKALLMVGGTPNETMDDADNNTVSLFGDACGAALFEAREGYNVKFSQFSDGNKMEYMYRRVGQPPKMNGMGLFNFAIGEVSDSINDFFEHYKINRDDIDCYFLHQAQKFMFDKIMEFCNLPEDKCPITYDVYGNTATASIPLTMSAHANDIDYKKRNKFFFCGFGGGLSWGNMVIETENVTVLPVESSNDKLIMEDCLC